MDDPFARVSPALYRPPAIAMATMFLSEHIGVRAIVAMTESGGTARYLSRFRLRKGVALAKWLPLGLLSYHKGRSQPRNAGL
jgi:hypothetical protein